MRCRFFTSLFVATLLAVLFAGCGGSPTTPPPPPPPPPVINPPANAAPSIDGITVQGRRPKQPVRFADLKETVDVTATVRDAETPLDDLIYQWSASAGTFTGTGRTVTWTAPDSASTPSTVTITLKVVENYGHPGQAKIYSHELSGTQTIALHDSVREVGRMSEDFLAKFSQPQTIKDWQEVMKDFRASACPQPGFVEEEKEDVIRHYTFFTMHTHTLQSASVRVNFGGGCSFRGRPGDACASVGVFWDSTDSRTGTRGTASGIDHVAAAYSSADSRWWLCSSDFEPITTFGHSFYVR